MRPLLLIININDIIKVVKHCTVSLYADDTCLYYAASNFLDLEKCVNEDLTSISKWLNYNGLLLNEKNCECMIIKPMRKTRLFNNVQVKINSSCINYIHQTNTCKYLGITVNDTLTWNKGEQSYIANARGKLTSALYCFKRIRPFISHDTVLILHKCLIQHHLDYYSIV